jgi:prepilin-type N-terminal cleavage/methylation domain-containing protein
MFKKKNKGFTLIELLIAIALIAILETAVILVFNPVELLKKARDGIRLSNLKNINTVLALAQFDNVSMGSSSVVYVSLPSDNSDCSDLSLPRPLPDGWSYYCSNSTNYQKPDGTGWIPIDFSSLSAFKIPISILPTDPINSAADGLYFTYTIGSSATPWELTDPLESSSYQTNYAANDSGTSPTVYETGKNIKITPQNVVDRDQEEVPPTLCGNNFIDSGEECDGTAGLSDPARMQCRSNCQGANITACGVSLSQPGKHYFIEQDLQGIELFPHNICITVNANNVTVTGNGTAKILRGTDVVAVKLLSGRSGARIEKVISTAADQSPGFIIEGTNSNFIENKIGALYETKGFYITGSGNTFERNTVLQTDGSTGFYFAPYDLSASGSNNTCLSCYGAICSSICSY